MSGFRFELERRALLRLAALGAVGTLLPRPAEAGGSYFNRRIPDEAHTQMGALSDGGITAVAFTPSNGWVIVNGSGGYFARGIPDECFAKLGEYVKAGHKIHCVAFPPAGGNRWTITTDKTFYARGIPDECYQRMLAYKNDGKRILHVAFPPQGGNRWIVVSTGGFFARNIDDECYQMVRNATQGGRKITRVVFDWKSGWVVVAEDHMWARRIDDECFDKMNALRADRWLLHNVAFAPEKSGWSLSSRSQHGSLAADRVRGVENGLVAKDGTKGNIWSRMKAHNVPGVAIAYVENDELAWATGYGWLEKGGKNAAHPESRFQAASVSKPVSAVGIVRLAQQRSDLALGDDVRDHLDKFTLKPRDCLDMTKKPTINRLLCHRGGVVGRGSTKPSGACSGFDPDAGGGFGGYKPGETVPSLLGVLKGEGNSPKIEISVDPGTMTFYSGHGFVVLQQMVEEKVGKSFASYMKSEVFDPLGMKHSTFLIDLPQAWFDEGQVATGHSGAGDVIEGKRRKHPESTAAGLYTSVVDLAKLICFLNAAWKSTDAKPVPGPLTRSSVRTMLTTVPNEDPGWARAYAISGADTTDFQYSHGGSNVGFKSTFCGRPERGTGYVVLVNGDSPTKDKLTSEIAAAIKATYGWS